MRKDFLLIGLIICTLLLMIMPLSTRVVDILLAVNMSLSVVLLMVAVYIKTPSDFSTFPSVILIGTVFRLALSIGSTRLILSEAEAGEIIATFGEFVVSGSVAIGLVIFLIITVVQFLVITKGAERVAEVGARFALDALPGKQLSIDADVRAGTITAQQAIAKREALGRESRFFGSMDGAMKFVKGDAIAGIIIIIINLIGGVAVGVSVHGYSFGEAVHVFSLLTVGDGLVAQIPALLMSLSAGMVVTRTNASDGTDLGSDISKELAADPRVPAVGAAIVLGMGFIPGFPFVIFAGIAALMVVVSFAIRKTIRVAAQNDADKKSEKAASDALKAEQEAALLDLRFTDRFVLALCADVSVAIDIPALNTQIADRFAELFAARGVRFHLPTVIQTPALAAPSFAIEIDEVPIFSAVVPADCVLVPDTAQQIAPEQIAGATVFVWPIFRGMWVPAAENDRVLALGCTPLPLAEAMADLVFRIYEQNAGQLFTHTIFEELMADARSTEPTTMKEIEGRLSLPQLFQMFRLLVEDGVPLRPLALVIASVAHWLSTTENATPQTLAEGVRGSMKRQLCHRIAGKEGVLGLAMVDPAIEVMARADYAALAKTLVRGQVFEGLAFTPEMTDHLLGQVRALSAPQTRNGRHIAIVISADLRPRFRNFLAAHGVHIPVLAPHELSAETTSYPLDLITALRPNDRITISPDSGRAEKRQKRPSTALSSEF